MIQKLSFFLLSLFLAAQLHGREVVRLAIGEWPPMLSADLEHYGFAARIVKEAFALEGMEVQYGFFPWKRSYEIARRGAWDGSAVWFRSPEREKDFYFSEPVVIGKYVFFHLKENAFRWKTIDDVKRMDIGATIGYYYGSAFEGAEKKKHIRVQRVHSDEQNFRKLLAGRIQIFPMDTHVGYHMLRKHFRPSDAQRITHHPQPLHEKPMFLLLSRRLKKNLRLMKIFDQGLRKLQKSGRVADHINGAR